VPEFFIGLMSGTSMDAIDVALVDFADGIRLVATHSHPWPAQLQLRLRQAAQGGDICLDELGRLGAACGDHFAEAALALLRHADLPAGQIRAIGSHGQTLAHNTNGGDRYSLQIGDAHRIAERTGITTVADFRGRDIAAGGEGAPLVPAFHQALTGEPEADIALLNIGGIANVTLLQADGGVIGFDTGPGNCLLDAWARQHLGRAYDHGGAWAASGTVQQDLLDQLLRDPYFVQPPPKSTSTQYFSPAWLAERLRQNPHCRVQDVQASLLALTATSISVALERHAAGVSRIYLCGGGAHNDALKQALRQQLKISLRTTSDLGIDPDWVEAAAFAWLARACLRGEPGNLPAVTGATRRVVLGVIHPA
jgi:anhydro-N-acetylmuramic acid kinase